MITSMANTQIKEIRKLHDRKYRRESGLFYGEGLRIVTEAIKQKVELSQLLVAPELLTSEFGLKLVEEQRAKGVPVLELSEFVFKSIAQKEGPQGIAGVFVQQKLKLDKITRGDNDLWVALDSVADPGNLGTILRTSDGVGGCGVILMDHSTDPYDPTTIRASMGAVFTQKIIETTFDEFAAWKKRLNFPLVGTSGAAQHDYHLTRYPPNLILLMGSEREGLNDQAIQLCDRLVSIPMVGQSDSLNLAVAAGVVLYEIFNQKREKQVNK
ncbi:MAG: RNA methyltransferase [Anaerolineaceae bacterium]|nr:RNA methyltransferase [Anaerolineaceae bacterium]